MRVGFVTQLMWERYGALWLRLVEDAGSQAVLPDPDAVRSAWSAPRVAAIAPLAFRLAAAQALALAHVDTIFVPDLNPDLDGPTAPSGGVAPGGAGDPWVADFAAALRTALAGLPPLVAVPASLEHGVDGAAVTALQNLMHDAHGVRRIWGRRRAEARPSRPNPPRWSRGPGERSSVGLVGQPWLLNDHLAERVRDDGEHIVAQHRLEPRTLHAEAERLGLPLVSTDAEVLGAGRLFARRGGIDVVRLLADRSSGADAWLAERLRSLSRKPVEVRYLQDVLGDDDPVLVLSSGVAGG